jgi:hypothetical protein
MSSGVDRGGVYRIGWYNVRSGYEADPRSTTADRPLRVTELILKFIEPAFVPGRDTVSTAYVRFVDQQAGPVTSVGEVPAIGAGSVTAYVSLPRDEFPAFWHAIRDAHGAITIEWNAAGKVTTFIAHGGEQFAPRFEETQELIDSQRRELRLDSGS